MFRLVSCSRQCKACLSTGWLICRGRSRGGPRRGLGGPRDHVSRQRRWNRWWRRLCSPRHGGCRQARPDCTDPWRGLRHGVLLGIWRHRSRRRPLRSCMSTWGEPGRNEFILWFIVRWGRHSYASRFLAFSHWIDFWTEGTSIKLKAQGPYCADHMKSINTLYEQNEKFLVSKQAVNVNQFCFSKT